MKLRLSVSLLLGFFVVASALRALDVNSDNVSVTGYVLDSACAFTKGLDKPISNGCAESCARNGSPLVILGSDGTIYWPISKETPAVGQNKRLMPFAGKHVSVSGQVFERGGSKAIVIDKIAESK